ncbi:hypothetical protein ERJ75_000462100 [Trypanosoma vivax]|uniref:Uncharacterized protein n=1 Tax=Trypanosoma vivax (strain Y486) TaxID=1055687 RepID=G0U562_TRYVY|nr:hypothetical protein TRVL_07329 [Trypanosoma vivax]KAH8616665.1 hypothetical protein ERJ75_000462100 [Trypanosoma vivax]CCC51010.1 conserved hypothetical protein [Trypanosoma vivax Y486]
MSQRYRGRSHRALLRKLPRNLVAFDGHCRMCQARVQYVLERNFSYFSLLNPTRDVDKDALEANKMLFCSFDSVEWQELSRQLPHLTRGAEGIVLFEKVPSTTKAFIDRVRQQGKSSTSLTGTFLASPSASLSPPLQSNAEAEEDMDILVSTKFSAVCRVGMKLDRWLPRTVARCFYQFLPNWVGDRWYERVLRRRRLWGTSEDDAVRHPEHLLGLKERTWRLRDK